MFTGIIEETGKLEKIERTKNGAIFILSASSIISDLKIGDSIAVNGACLTIVKLNKKNFMVELSPETLEKTSFMNITIGELVNLERPLKLNDRLGGHLVSGHVDGVGQLIGKKQEGNSIIMKFAVPSDFEKYLIPKGSIAIDGISMTVVDIHGNQFTIAAIPHTLTVTTLEHKKIGDDVNLEFDLIAKYIERFSQFSSQKESINLEFLQSNGFV